MARNASNQATFIYDVRPGIVRENFFLIILTIFIAYKIFALKYDYGHPLRYPISYLFITALWLEIISEDGAWR